MFVYGLQRKVPGIIVYGEVFVKAITYNKLTSDNKPYTATWSYDDIDLFNCKTKKGFCLNAGYGLLESLNKQMNFQILMQGVLDFVAGWIMRHQCELAGICQSRSV